MYGIQDYPYNGTEFPFDKPSEEISQRVYLIKSTKGEQKAIQTLTADYWFKSLGYTKSNQTQFELFTHCIVAFPETGFFRVYPSGLKIDDEEAASREWKQMLRKLNDLEIYAEDYFMMTLGELAIFNNIQTNM